MTTIDPSHDRAILKYAARVADTKPTLNVVAVRCPHTIGLALADTDGTVTRLPCPCDDRADVLAHLVAAGKLDEIDRNARAYGWEIGNGHPLTEVLDTNTEGNPFLDPAWRQAVTQ